VLTHAEHIASTLPARFALEGLRNAHGLDVFAVESVQVADRLL